MLKKREFVNPFLLLEPAAEFGSYLLVQRHAYGAVHGQVQIFQAYFKRQVNSRWQSYLGAFTAALLVVAED